MQLFRVVIRCKYLTLHIYLRLFILGERWMSKDGVLLVVVAAVVFSRLNSDCDTRGDARIVWRPSQRFAKVSWYSYRDHWLQKTLTTSAGYEVTCHVSINDSAGVAAWYSSQNISKYGIESHVCQLRTISHTLRTAAEYLP